MTLWWVSVTGLSFILILIVNRSTICTNFASVIFRNEHALRWSLFPHTLFLSIFPHCTICQLFSFGCILLFLFLFYSILPAWSFVQILNSTLSLFIFSFICEQIYLMFLSWRLSNVPTRIWISDSFGKQLAYPHKQHIFNNKNYSFILKK